MTPIKPEDRPKVIALLAAVAVVFGYGLLQAAKILAPGSGGGAATPVADTGTAAPGGVAPASVASAPAGASGAANETTAPATGAAPSSAAPAPGTVLVTNDRPIVRPNLTKNPFKPLPPPEPVVGTTPGGTGTAAAAPSSPSRVTVDESPRQMRSTPADTPEVAAPALPRTASKQASAPPPAPERFVPPAPNGPRVLPAPVVPAKPLQLVGVVWGTRPVAMIRVGGQEFFVRQGERVADYRVIGLGMENVTLRSDQQARFVLRVGDPPLGGAPPLAAPTPEAVSFAAPVPPPAVAGSATAPPAPPIVSAATQAAAAPLPPATQGIPALGSSEAAALDPAPSTAPDPAPETPDPATPPEPRPAAPLDTFATMPPAMPRTVEPDDGGADG